MVLSRRKHPNETWGEEPRLADVAVMANLAEMCIHPSSQLLLCTQIPFPAPPEPADCHHRLGVFGQRY